MEHARQGMRDARELALNLLFQVDVARLTLKEAIQTATENAKVSPEVLESAVELATGAWSFAKQADKLASSLAPEWPTDRQPGVDRNILRLGLYELLCRPDVPAAVAMNEAVELAKTYSTEDSGRFVNGILAGALKKRENKEG